METMSDSAVRQRLMGCFQAVFSSLSPSEISTASTESVEEWDSIAHVTLLSVVEEEFGLTASPETAAELTSFEAMRRFVEPQAG